MQVALSICSRSTPKPASFRSSLCLGLLGMWICEALPGLLWVAKAARAHARWTRAGHASFAKSVRVTTWRFSSNNGVVHGQSLAVAFLMVRSGTASHGRSCQSRFWTRFQHEPFCAEHEFL